MAHWGSVLLAFALLTTACTLGADVQQNGEISASGDDVSCSRVPPSMWCANDKIEEKCGFADKCRQYRSATSESWNKPVLLTLLYETLCPGCQGFITSVLPQLMGLFDERYLQVELVPFGNAEMKNSTTIICQHGEEECKGNKFESCALRFIQKPIPFIICMERYLSVDITIDNAAKRCFRALNVSHIVYDQINHCYRGTQGNDLQKLAGERTEGIWPEKHLGVPWVLVNNVSLVNQQPILESSLYGTVCGAYVGDHNPCSLGLRGGLLRFMLRSGHRGPYGKKKAKKPAMCPKNW